MIHIYIYIFICTVYIVIFQYKYQTYIIYIYIYIYIYLCLELLSHTCEFWFFLGFELRFQHLAAKFPQKGSPKSFTFIPSCQNGQVIYVVLIYAYRPDPAPLRVFELTERADDGSDDQEWWWPQRADDSDPSLETETWGSELISCCWRVRFDWGSRIDTEKKESKSNSPGFEDGPNEPFMLSRFRLKNQQRVWSQSSWQMELTGNQTEVVRYHTQYYQVLFEQA